MKVEQRVHLNQYSLGFPLKAVALMTWEPQRGQMLLRFDGFDMSFHDLAGS